MRVQPVRLRGQGKNVDEFHMYTRTAATSVKMPRIPYRDNIETALDKPVRLRQPMRAFGSCRFQRKHCT